MLLLVFKPDNHPQKLITQQGTVSTYSSPMCVTQARDWQLHKSYMLYCCKIEGSCSKWQKVLDYQSPWFIETSILTQAIGPCVWAYGTFIPSEEWVGASKLGISHHLESLKEWIRIHSVEPYWFLLEPENQVGGTRKTRWARRITQSTVVCTKGDTPEH